MLARISKDLEDVMGKQRKQRTADEKAALVMATFREDVGVAEVARQHGVDESLLHKWPRAFMEGGKQAFRNGAAPSSEKVLQRENEQLKKVLGEKTLEVEILKKLGSL
jgi:transposase